MHRAAKREQGETANRFKIVPGTGLRRRCIRGTPQVRSRTTKASKAATASFLVSAIQISCSARLALVCRLFGSLFRPKDRDLRVWMAPQAVN